MGKKGNSIETNEGDYYLTYDWVARRLKLSATCAQIYSIIYGFTVNSKAHKFEGSASYLARKVKCSKRQVFRILKKLTAEKYLIKEEFFSNGMKYCNYFVNKDVISDKMSPGSDKMSSGSDKMSSGGGDKMSPHNKYIQNKEQNKEQNKSGGINDVILNFSEDKKIQDSLQRFVKMRTSNGYPVTRTSLKLLLRRLDELSEGDGIITLKIIERSLKHGWSQFYDLPKEADRKNERNRPEILESNDLDKYLSMINNFD